MAIGFNINDPASDIQQYDDEMLKEFVRPVILKVLYLNQQE